MAWELLEILEQRKKHTGSLAVNMIFRDCPKRNVSRKGSPTSGLAIMFPDVVIVV
jgi:hypothetical protein